MADENLLLLAEKLKDIIDSGVKMSLKSSMQSHERNISRMNIEAAAVEEYYATEQRPGQLSALAEFGQNIMDKGARHKVAVTSVSFDPTSLDIMQEELFKAMRDFACTGNRANKEI